MGPIVGDKAPRADVLCIDKAAGCSEIAESLCLGRTGSCEDGCGRSVGCVSVTSDVYILERYKMISVL